jgi:hypothetical protein
MKVPICLISTGSEDAHQLFDEMREPSVVFLMRAGRTPTLQLQEFEPSVAMALPVSHLRD